jgi:tripartite-type tricarboxylate transporter receptor subunit TctC
MNPTRRIRWAYTFGAMALSTGELIYSSGGIGGASHLPAELFKSQARINIVNVSRLNQEIVQMLNRPEVKDRHFTAGVETVASSPEELSTTMKSDSARWGTLIKGTKFRVA